MMPSLFVFFPSLFQYVINNTRRIFQPIADNDDGNAAYYSPRYVMQMQSARHMHRKKKNIKEKRARGEVRKFSLCRLPATPFVCVCVCFFLLFLPGSFACSASVSDRCITIIGSRFMHRWILCVCESTAACKGKRNKSKRARHQSVNAFGKPLLLLRVTDRLLCALCKCKCPF